jgi:hypothetical protein
MLCKVVPICGVEVWMHPDVPEQHRASARAADILARYIGIVERVEIFEDGSALIVHPRESKLASVRVVADADLGWTRGFR